MKLEDFDFDLPPECIALRPARPRDTARLLVVTPDDEGGTLRDADIPALMDAVRPGDALVFNDTRVIPARLIGRRVGRGDTEPKVEVTLLKEEESGVWQGFARPAKKLELGDKLYFPGKDTDGEGLLAEVCEKRERGEVCVRFHVAAGEFHARLSETGQMPLPPYIASKRAPDADDAQDYQTVYATRQGAVAAPTAGLHFTEDMLASLKDKGVQTCFVTLHVGAGTFLPVQVENISEHKMHSEFGELSEDAAEMLNRVKAEGGRIVSVGTTSLRLLESAADASGRLHAFHGETDIFISPGYRFKVVDLLLTNFHLPKSTLFMLVSAFSGLDLMKRAYRHAVETGYRFYSYGDACLLTRDGGTS